MQTISREEIFMYYYNYGMWWYMDRNEWERRWFELNPKYEYSEIKKPVIKRAETLKAKAHRLSKKLGVNKQELLQYFTSLV